jgi:hypothetical protein
MNLVKLLFMMLKLVEAYRMCVKWLRIMQVF